MTHENKKQAILDKIREVCDLKRLEFGCEVEEKPAFGSKFRNENPYNGKWLATIKDNTECWLFPADIGFVRVPESQLISWHKIIGLPVQLNHLLRVLARNKDFTRNSELCLSFFEEKETLFIEHTISHQSFNYNLTLSVEQNLDNEPLADLIYELIV